MFAKLARRAPNRKAAVVPTSKAVSARKYSKYNISDPPTYKQTDLGRFKAAFKSDDLDESVARIREVEAEMKKFKELPLLDSTAREVLKDLSGVVPPEGLKVIEDKLKQFEKAPDPLQLLKSIDLLTPGDPTYNSKVVDVFMKHYNKLYATIQENSGDDVWPAAFYDLPPRQQQGIRKFREATTAALASLKPKFGGASSVIAQRLENVQEITSGNHFSEIPTGPIRVAITGASGQIGYALAFRIAAGGLFGPTVPVELHLLELPVAMDSLRGLVMELQDCAYPALRRIVATDNPDVAFEGVDWALLVGATPRKPGMERGDLLNKNAEIFALQGKSLDRVGKKDGTRVVVVGNPANTNALIAQQNAPNIPAENFSAMTKLDHNRGLSQLAAKLGCHVTDIHNFVIWGNHSATQFPDVSHAYVNVNSAGNVVSGRIGAFPDGTHHRLITDLVDPEWLTKTFIPTVQQRGAAVLAARGVSSAQSAASALIDSVHDWQFGTQTEWSSAAVVSRGEYGVTKGLFYSYPVIYNASSKWDIVKHLPIDEFSANLMEATHKELLQERDAVAKFLPGTTGGKGAGFTMRKGSGPDGDGLDLNFS